MPKLIVMIGLSGAGKTSTAADEYKGYNIISTDNIREEICGERSDQSKNNKVFELFHKRIVDSLKAERSTVADATNLTFKSRRSLLHLVENIDCWKVAHIVVKPFYECLRSNDERNTPVPRYVIRKQMEKFQIPFYEEGFNEIIIDDKGHGQFKTRYVDYCLSQMSDFDQRNPHHVYTLDVHSKKVAAAFSKYDYSRAYQLGALLHDYGKIATQFIDPFSEVAHYYSHENVGAYMLLCSYSSLKALALTDGEIIDMLFLVNYHMLPFAWKTQKAQRRWQKSFGGIKYNLLMDFHECDKGASL